jgi:hypothetical protein
MKTDQIKPTEKTTLRVSKNVLPENLRVLRSSSALSFQSLFQKELEKRKSESDSNYDQNVDKYHSLITEFIENLLANSGRSFLILKKTGVSDAVHQIIVEMRKELGISMLNPLHNHIKDVADFIERKNSLYSNNQSKYRDPVGALYTGSV